MKRASALVDYADSDDDSGDEAPVPKKRKQLPSLAPSLTLPVPTDNPALHQGRVRSSPHVEGQFAAYVYVPLKLVLAGSCHSLLRKVVKRAEQIVPIIHPIGIILERDVTAIESETELHISLTRPIYLRAHQREELKVALKKVAKAQSRFHASFATFAELTNDERTRTFLTLEIGAGHTELKALCDAITPVLRAFRQKEFYSEPRFHASVAWALLSMQGAASSGAIARSSDRDVTDEVSTASTAEERKDSTEFPTIPQFPPGLVAMLETEFGSELRSRNVGAFECEHLCVRIGKEVIQWKLLD